MESFQSTADPELAIWERVFVPNPERITREQARYLLDVKFSKSDLARINALSAKANEGNLEAAERIELDRYIHVGHLLSILKAKIRGSKDRRADGSPAS